MFHEAPLKAAESDQIPAEGDTHRSIKVQCAGVCCAAVCPTVGSYLRALATDE